MSRRRDMLKILSMTVGMLIALPAAILHAKKYSISLDKAEKLKTVNSSALLKIKDRQILFVRDSEKTIRALDPTCTHRQCTVDYNSKTQNIVCPCHGSTYNLEGKVIKGPAEKALTVFSAELSDNNIILTMD
jgi:Rieske Fe-S protein